MEMHQVRYFLAAAEHLNFTRAAERLHVTQPSLTRAIQKLEEELGGPLFRRERANTHLTELGRMMLPHLSASLAAAEAAKHHAESFRKREVGELSVGAGSTVCAQVGAGLLAAVADEFEHLDLSVEVDTEATIESRLVAGGLDAALLAPVSDLAGRLDFLPVRADPFVVAFAAGHRFAASDEVPLDALDGEPLVTCAGCVHGARLDADLRARGVAPLVRARADDDAWAAELARRGLGVIVVPEVAARWSGLAYRRLAGPGPCHQIGLVTVAGRHRSPALAALVRHARATARGLPRETAAPADAAAEAGGPS